MKLSTIYIVDGFFNNMSKTLIIHTRSSSLLPKAVYSKELKKNIFEHGRQKDLSENLVVLEDKVSDEIINLWSLEKKDLDKLKVQYEFSKVTHSSTSFIKSCLDKSKDGIYFNKINTGIEVLVITSDNVQLYNSLFGSENQDLLYYILLYQERYGKELKIYVSSIFDKEALKLLKEYIADVKTITVAVKTIIESQVPHYTVLKCE